MHENIGAKTGKGLLCLLTQTWIKITESCSDFDIMQSINCRLII